MGKSWNEIYSGNAVSNYLSIYVSVQRFQLKQTTRRYHSMMWIQLYDYLFSLAHSAAVLTQLMTALCS